MSWGIISEMGHVAIQTQQLDASVWDATELLGLRVTEREGDHVYLAAADVHHELIYIGSEHNGIDHIGLVARDAAALDEVRRRVDAAGLEVISENPLHAYIDEGFAFVGFDGFVFEIYLAATAGKTPRKGFGPDRYGHINIHHTDATAAMHFYTEVLDFRISDIIGDDFAYFMRCNPDHHGIAVLAGRGTFHHHAWQTQSIADLGLLADRLEAAGRRLIWGPVRHGAGHNIAAYFVEPTDTVIELYADMEQIYDDDRPPVVWGREGHRWFNRWGVYNGEEFRSHGAYPAPRG